MKEAYEIKAIHVDLCMPFIYGIHYAKRKPSISYAYGLFTSNRLVGCVTYGTPPSATLRNGICGENFACYVIELNRLVLKNNKPNEASLLVGNSLRLLPAPKVVVSFADTEQSHIGTVYQSCNFLYCGLSAKRTNWTVKGREHLHGQTIADEFRGLPDRAKLMREKYGDDFTLEPRSLKHRYIQFVGDKRFKRSAIAALRYQIQPYPKANLETAK